MQISYPHTIDNTLGETIIFHNVELHPEGEKVMGENFVAPGIGPVMHTHWLQDEVFTVISGNLGYERKGEGKKFAGAGETVVFKKGEPHRFWNAGTDTLHCKGYMQPAFNSVFFLSALFAAQAKNKSAKPEIFDAAFLLTRYQTEFDLAELPVFVKKTVLPFICFLGKCLGKYKKFQDAPAPVTVK